MRDLLTAYSTISVGSLRCNRSKYREFPNAGRVLGRATSEADAINDNSADKNGGASLKTRL
jgi:hypothetical protein